MQNGLKRLLFVLILTFTLGNVESLFAMDGSKMTVSLITCSPDEDVYSLYGHTAIRCRDNEGEFDYVFNYGVFSFEQPYFILRFVLGSCDYMVQPIPWNFFVHEYESRGRRVIEQVLNLTESEAYRITIQLINESRPENCNYRYDFFRNNCTTKVRDVIENSLDVLVVYPELEELKGCTYRQMLHHYNEVDPWSSEGCDLLLGADVDTLLTQRASTFLPITYMKFVDEAVLRDSINSSRPMVLNKHVVIEGKPLVIYPVFPLTPTQTFWLLLAIFVLIAMIECALHYQFWIIDVVVLFSQGLIGLLLLFLMVLSSHPGVHENWLVILFNPIALWGLFLTVKAAWKRERSHWHAVNACLIVAFLVFSMWMPQKFGNIVLPLTLILLTRPVSYMLYYRK